MSTKKLKAMIAAGNTVRFTRYFDAQLWYEVRYRDPDNTTGGEALERFEFPVPISDIGGATFLAEDKAALMMRYIRKHLDMLDAAKTGGGTA